MAEHTKIQWCDHTFNHVRGCTKVSEGCRFCYADSMSGRNPSTLGVWGPQGTRVVAAESYWRQPLKWNRQAQADRAAAEASLGYLPPRPRVFCASLADVFEGPETMPEASVPAVTAARERLFRLIESTPHLDWLLLTKRPQNVLPMTHDAWCQPVPGHVSQNEGDGRHWHWPPNVWLGVSVENQKAAEERIPRLLQVPAAIRFLSVEPQLEDVDVSGWLESDLDRYRRDDRFGIPADANQARIDWVICGGESGSNARPFRLAWARSLRDQCQSAGVAFFLKQLGANCPDAGRAGEPLLSIRDRKGGDWEDWPADLRVRELPSLGAVT